MPPTATDPRLSDTGLGWVTRSLFGDERVRVSTGPALPGRRVAARYAVVPSLERPRFLLPLAGRRVITQSLLAYNALRPLRVRASRAALGALLGVAPGVLRRMPILTVDVPAGLDPADALLADHLGVVLHRRVHAAIGVHPPDPNRKPTLQLFDDQARPTAYVKVGWNDATRQMVATEAGALRQVPAGLADYPLTPSVLAEGALGELTFVATSPLPPAVRRMPDTAPPALEAMLAVARRGGPPAARVPLRHTPLTTRLEAEARRAGADRDAGVGPADALCGVLAAHVDLPLELGWWHGDWVPWNLGRHRGTTVAWDWEHCGRDMPVGSDLAHQAFQVALTVRGDEAAAATAAADGAVGRGAGALGLSAAGARAVVDIYLAELWLRTWRLARGGAGWNQRLHPALVEILRTRGGR